MQSLYKPNWIEYTKDTSSNITYQTFLRLQMLDFCHYLGRENILLSIYAFYRFYIPQRLMAIFKLCIFFRFYIPQRLMAIFKLCIFCVDRTK